MKSYHLEKNITNYIHHIPWDIHTVVLWLVLLLIIKPVRSIQLFTDILKSCITGIGVIL